MSTVKELEEKVKELLEEIETLKQKEKAEEFGYPFKENEPYEVIIEDGRIVTSCWTNHNMDCERYEQGNVFKTRDEAIRERDKRALLTRFRQFRDKCNGDWKPTINEKNIISFLTLKNKNLKLIGFLKLEYLNCWVPSKTKQMQNVLSNYSVMRLSDCGWRNDFEILWRNILFHPSRRASVKCGMA